MKSSVEQIAPHMVETTGKDMPAQEAPQAQPLPLHRRARAAHPPGYLHQAAAEDLCLHRLSAGVPSSHPAALLRDLASALRRGQTDGGRPRGAFGHRLLRAHLLPPPAGIEGAGGRLHAHHAPPGRRAYLQSRRRLFSEAAQRMIVAFVEIHFSKKIVIALPPRLRYVVLAK